MVFNYIAYSLILSCIVCYPFNLLVGYVQIKRGAIFDFSWYPTTKAVIFYININIKVVEEHD